MRILVTYPLSSELVESGLGDLVVYRPEPVSQGESAVRQALGQHLPDAMLVDGCCPIGGAGSASHDLSGRPHAGHQRALHARGYQPKA